MNTRLSVILSELRSRFQGLFGPQLKQLILFGSQARGDADPESDIDVLVVLSSEKAIEEMKRQANEIVSDLSLSHDTVISCVFTTKEMIDHSGLPFYRNVRREGVRI